MSVSILRSLWANHRTGILLFAVVLMALVALPWLGLNFEKLLWEQGPWGATDLKRRYNEMQLWSAGLPVYNEMGSAVYPPASYVMLWPLLGWLDFTSAKVVWAATTAIALGWLVYLLVRESGANTRLERLFVVLMLLSMFATGFTVGHGQLAIHVLAPLVAGLILVCRGQHTWQRDLVAAALILAALVKPTISAPFFWLVIFIPGRLRPALLVVLGYVTLTLLAVPFQGWDLLSLHHGWIERALGGAARGAARGAYGNVHSWLAVLEFENWGLHASLLVLLGLGYWIYRHRHGDLWLLIGVSAIVARFWVYHRAYDDMLLLLPMITLFRIAKQDTYRNQDSVVAGVLLAVTMIAMFATGLRFVLPTWEPLLKSLQGVVHIVLLIFLLYRGWVETASQRHLYLVATARASN